MPIDLGHIYDQHAQALFAFLLNLTRSEAETRDILQDLFARLAARPGLLDQARNTRSYLIRLAHNLAIDGHRRRSRETAAHERTGRELYSVFSISPDPDEAAFRGRLAEALGELPPEQRAVVHLKLWEEMTFAQISDALDIPLNTAASRYRYGIDKLQTQLRPLYEEIR